MHSNIRNNRNCDAVTKTGLLILAEIRSGELITQMAVTSRLHKHVNNAQMIYEYTLAYKTCVF